MVELNICIGSSCHLKGSYEVLRIFQELVEERGLQDKVEMKGRFCMGKCQEGVSVSIEKEFHSVLPETARAFFAEMVAPRAK